MPTLYVKEQGAVLSRIGEQIIAQKEGKILAEMPALQVERIVLLGNVHLTTPLSAFLLARQIDTVFLSSRGRYRGRLLPRENGNTALRRHQYVAADDPTFCLALARTLIAGKLRNQASLLARRDNEQAHQAANQIRHLAEQSEKAETLEILRGYEGLASRTYFAAFPHILKTGFTFSTRIKHPPTDPVNVLLSLGYTLLHADVLSALYLVGFDPFVGFFHQERPGHATLASDLMEEFRAPIVDVVVLGLCNRGAITPESFERTKGPGIRIRDQGVRLFFEEYERRMQTRVKVLARDLTYPYRAALEQQARCLADVVQGNRETYCPFHMRQ